MNFIRLSVIFAIGLLASLAVPEYMLYNTRAVSSTDSYYSFNGSMPNAYRLVINFEDDDYQHTHTINNGSTTLGIDVNKSVKTIHLDNVHLVDIDAKCNVKTVNGAAFNETITVNFKETIKIAGTISDETIKEMVRNHIINQIIKEISKL